MLIELDVLELLKYEPLTFDEIKNSLKLSTSDLNRALLNLEDKGLVAFEPSVFKWAFVKDIRVPGSWIFDETTVYFAIPDYALLAMEKFAEEQSSVSFLILPKIGGYYLRPQDSDLNQEFLAFLEKRIPGNFSIYPPKGKEEN